MFNNKLKLAVAGLAVSLSLPMAAAHADKIVVATDTGFVPFAFRQDGQHTGFDVQLWDAIAKEANIEYELRPMDFNGIIPGIQTGNIDVAIAGMSIREDRQKVVDFSQPYYESGLALLVHDNEEEIKTAADLDDKLVAVRIGTVAVDYMKENVPGAKLKLFPNMDNSFMELSTKRVDAVVHDTPNLQYYAQTAGKGRVKVVGSLSSGDNYGIAFTKGSELTAMVDKALDTIKENGVYDSIYETWFGKKPE